MDKQELQTYLRQELDTCLAEADKERQLAKKHAEKAEYWSELAKCTRAVLFRASTIPVVTTLTSEK